MQVDSAIEELVINSEKGLLTKVIDHAESRQEIIPDVVKQIDDLNKKYDIGKSLGEGVFGIV
jgi:hypothetical protein